jgi:hypothetical protein
VSLKNILDKIEERKLISRLPNSNPGNQKPSDNNKLVEITSEEEYSSLDYDDGSNEKMRNQAPKISLTQMMNTGRSSLTFRKNGHNDDAQDFRNQRQKDMGCIVPPVAKRRSTNFCKENIIIGNTNDQVMENDHVFLNGDYCIRANSIQTTFNMNEKVNFETDLYTEFQYLNVNNLNTFSMYVCSF